MTVFRIMLYRVFRIIFYRVIPLPKTERYVLKKYTKNRRKLKLKINFILCDTTIEPYKIQFSKILFSKNYVSQAMFFSNIHVCIFFYSVVAQLLAKTLRFNKVPFH